jgi:hypothetical protein
MREKFHGTVVPCALAVLQQSVTRQASRCDGMGTIPELVKLYAHVRNFRRNGLHYADLKS